MLSVHGIDTLLSTRFRQVVNTKEVVITFYITKLLILVKEEEKE